MSLHQTQAGSDRHRPADAVEVAVQQCVRSSYGPRQGVVRPAHPLAVTSTLITCLSTYNVGYK